MKRLLLFVHYDRDGRVDAHAVRLFRALAGECAESVWIQNGEPEKPDTLDPAGIPADRIVLRENRGFDFGAWGEVLSRDRERIRKEYDELLLANSSCYGPLFPLKDYFDRMDPVSCDIWGMTEHHACRGLPAHLQSYFLVIRRRVLQSGAFWNFWADRARSFRTMEEAVEQGEMAFSAEMRAAGFRLESCIRPRDLRENPRVGIVESFSVNNADWLIRNYRLPLLKVKAFQRVPNTPVRRAGALLETLGECGSDYPVSLIVGHLRRTAPLSWQTALPQTLLLEPETPPSPVPLKLAVMLHAYRGSRLEELLRFCGNLPLPFDLFLTTGGEEVPPLPFVPPNLKTFRHLPVSNRGRDVLPWLTALPVGEHLSYDVVLKIHSKNAPNQPESFGDDWRNWTLANLVGSSALAGAVLEAFAGESALGMVFPPPPPVVIRQCPEALSGTAADGRLREELLEKLHLAPPPESDQPVFGVGTMFYYRPAALRPLLENPPGPERFPEEPMPWRGTMAHAVERIPAYVAQGQGYYFRQSLLRTCLAGAFRYYESCAAYPSGTVGTALRELKKALVRSWHWRFGRR